MASRLESYFLDVIGEPGRSGTDAVLLRWGLVGLAGLYDIGLEAYLLAEKLGLRRRAHLPVRVLSIGNLTVGGTGKTPMTQFLCRRLRAAGKHVAVLSRGYGGNSQSVRIVSDAEGHVSFNAAEAGDEPVLLAQTLPGVPVLVGKDRRLSGREALRRFGLDMLVLDDGFQYWQLFRDLDIVLLDSLHPFGNGYPLPRGLLREPKRHLRRARIVVATRTERANTAQRAFLEAEVHCLAPNAALFFADHRSIGFVPVDHLAAPLLPLAVLARQRVFVISAIAQPQSFVDALVHDAGAVVVGQKAWGDHHAFDPAQAQAVYAEAIQSGAAALVMTEKDAVKWPAGASELPTYALRIEMAVENEAGFLAKVLTYAIE